MFLSLLPDEILHFLAERGSADDIRPYNGRQVFEWLHKRHIFDASRFTNISKGLRRAVADYINESARLRIVERERAKDGAVKFLMEAEDGLAFESVYIPFRDRATICLSSQIGCRRRCAFCYTGRTGFRRDLSASEIVMQAYLIEKELGKATHIVFMGMGEPLDNPDNVLRAITLLSHKDGDNISQRRITLSTVGVKEGMMRLLTSGLKVNLAVSLHSPFSDVRAKIAPIERQQPFSELLPLYKRYYKKTKRQVTFEYTLLEGINDDEAHIYALKSIADGWDVKYNIIALNENGKNADRHIANAKRFAAKLKREGLKATLRVSRGRDISGACGMLAGGRDAGKGK